MLRTVHRYSDGYEEDKLSGYQLARVVKHGTVDVREAKFATSLFHNAIARGEMDLLAHALRMKNAQAWLSPTLEASAGVDVGAIAWLLDQLEHRVGGLLPCHRALREGHEEMCVAILQLWQRVAGAAARIASIPPPRRAPNARMVRWPAIAAEDVVDAPDDSAGGQTLLHAAATDGNLMLVARLLALGADLCGTSVAGCDNALHCACRGRHADLAILLVRRAAAAGLDLEDFSRATNTAGETPSQVARRFGHGDFAEFVEEHIRATRLGGGPDNDNDDEGRDPFATFDAGRIYGLLMGKASDDKSLSRHLYQFRLQESTAREAVLRKRPEDLLWESKEAHLQKTLQRTLGRTGMAGRMGAATDAAATSALLAATAGPGDLLQATMAMTTGPAAALEKKLEEERKRRQKEDEEMEKWGEAKKEKKWWGTGGKEARDAALRSSASLYRLTAPPIVRPSILDAMKDARERARRRPDDRAADDDSHVHDQLRDSFGSSAGAGPGPGPATIRELSHSASAPSLCLGTGLLAEHRHRERRARVARAYDIQHSRVNDLFEGRVPRRILRRSRKPDEHQAEAAEAEKKKKKTPKTKSKKKKKKKEKKKKTSKGKPSSQAKEDAPKKEKKEKKKKKSSAPPPPKKKKAVDDGGGGDRENTA